MKRYSDDTSFSFSDLPGDIEIGRYTSIARDCIFHEANDNHYCVENKKCVYTIDWDHAKDKRNTKIGNDVWVARGVRVLYGVTIGDGAIIGAGAVISKDVPAYAFIVGNPQIIKRFRFDTEQITKLLNLKWWDFEKEKLEKVKPFMNDIDIFLLKCEEYGYFS